MEYSDIEVILNNMKPLDRFVFGMKYLFIHIKDKVSGKDEASPFLHQECLRQSVLLRRIDAGDIQI